MGKIVDKLKIIILAILGGTDATIYIFSPIILAALWAIVNGLSKGSYFFYGVCLCATIFRAFKIGWMK